MMNEDQRARFEALQSRLLDQLFDDADPENWPGFGQKLNEMDQETRGHAMWSRKTAVQTVTLFDRVRHIEADPQGATGKNSPDDEDIDKAIERAEKAASQALERIGERGRKQRAAK